MRSALELFERQGFEATTMEAIAAGAGVSRPTVFNHFAHKEDLLHGVGELLRAHVSVTIQHLHHEGSFAEPLQALKALMVAMAAPFTAFPRSALAFHHLTMRSLGDDRQADGPPERSPVEGERDLARLLIESAQTRGLLRRDYPAEELADLLLMSLFAATVGPWLAGRHRETPLDALIERHVELFLSGARGG
jgi:AcrR family transcriptional regulator